MTIRPEEHYELTLPHFDHNIKATPYKERTEKAYKFEPGEEWWTSYVRVFLEWLCVEVLIFRSYRYQSEAFVIGTRPRPSGMEIASRIGHTNGVDREDLQQGAEPHRLRCTFFGGLFTEHLAYTLYAGGDVF